MRLFINFNLIAETLANNKENHFLLIGDKVKILDGGYWAQRKK